MTTCTTEREEPRTALAIYDKLDEQLNRARALSSLLHAADGRQITQDDRGWVAAMVRDYINSASTLAEELHDMCGKSDTKVTP